MSNFSSEMEERRKKASRPQEGIRIASGMTVYNKNTDKKFRDVFKRADMYMYENKKMLKEGIKDTWDSYHLKFY